MMNRSDALLVAAALSVAGVVHAQATQGSRVSDSALATVNASMRAEVRAIGDSALAAGLPLEPILDLARQYKNRPASSVIPVVSQLLRNLRTSQVALGAGASHEDIKVGAVALNVGVGAQTLTKIATDKRNAELYVSLSVLSDLVTSSVPVDTAVRMVSRLLASGVRNADLSTYRDNVRNDIALGTIPSAAATLRGEALILRTGSTDFNSAGPVTRVNTGGRVRIPPEEN